MRESRALLDQMIVQQAEVVPLREDRRLIVERAVLEMDRESRRDPIAMGNLDHVTVGKGFALQSFY